MNELQFVSTKKRAFFRTVPETNEGLFNPYYGFLATHCCECGALHQLTTLAQAASSNLHP